MEKELQELEKALDQAIDMVGRHAVALSLVDIRIPSPATLNALENDYFA